MRHKLTRHRLNRFTSWREATLKSIARSVLLNQSIKTSRGKAKAAQPLVENLITLARADDLTARRRAFAILQDHDLVKLLFSDIGPRFASRNGGYTRILNSGNRRGDDASMVIFELTEIKKKEVKKSKKEQAATVETETSEGAAPGEKPRHEEKPREEKKTAAGPAVPEKKKDRPQTGKKPTKKFLGGLRNIFKKERDSL